MKKIINIRKLLSQENMKSKKCTLLRLRKPLDVQVYNSLAYCSFAATYKESSWPKETAVVAGIYHSRNSQDP